MAVSSVLTLSNDKREKNNFEVTEIQVKWDEMQRELGEFINDVFFYIN